MSETNNRPKPDLSVDQGDGFSSRISGPVSDGPMSVTVTGPGGKSWQGTATGISEAVNMVGRIVLDQRAATARALATPVAATPQQRVAAAERQTKGITA